MRTPGQSPGCASAPPASLLQAAPVAVRWGRAAELGRQVRSSCAPPQPHSTSPAPVPLQSLVGIAHCPVEAGEAQPAPSA
jgi:hypothetical protein